MKSRSHHWTIVLAGGDGRRLETLTRDPSGLAVPKQFWRFRGTESLLAQTLRRLRPLGGLDRVIVVVRESHRRWWASELAGLHERQLVVQTAARGTGVALLHAMHRALEFDRDPAFLVLPTDHAVEDEAAWNRTLERAMAAAQRRPQQAVLVGAAPQSDPNYGWILPGERSSDGTLAVLAFREKPHERDARELTLAGALCSTFAFAISGRALLRLFARHSPDLLTACAEGFAASWPAMADPADVFAALPVSDFSRDVLQRAIRDLRVLPAISCGWTDLGTPDRVARWLGRRRAELAGA